MNRNKNDISTRWAMRFFRWFCNPEYVEDIEGDLLEQYDKRLSKGYHANWYLILDVLRLFRPSLIRSFEGTQQLNSIGMLRNYAKITYRSMLRQKLHSTINIGCLSIGIAAFLLIHVFVQHEKSFDKFIANHDHIYQVYLHQPENQSLGSDFYAVTPAALPQVLVQEFPEVSDATTLDIYNTLLQTQKATFIEDVLFADEHYFEVFELPFIQGNPKTALSDKTGAVVTRSFAKTAFPGKDPMGQEIKFWNGKTAFVSGIIEDLPNTSSMQFSVVLSIQNSSYYLQERAKEKWNGNSYYTFFKLNPSASADQLTPKLQSVVKKYWAHTNIPTTYQLSPLNEFHLRAGINEDFGIKGNADQLNLFNVIGWLVLIIACINYTNLAIARSVTRAKEVGLRKSIGANQTQLIFQFISESTFFAVIGLFIGLLLLWAFLPVFGGWFDRSLDITTALNWDIMPQLFALVFGIGLLSGSYPAFFMSKLEPIKVLKGNKIEIKANRFSFQKTLIVMQYATSIVMIMMSVIILKQMDFITSKDLGFQKNQIIAVELRDSKARENVEVIRQQLGDSPLTHQVSFSSNLPTDIESSTFLRNDRTGGNIYRLYADENFAKTYELELISGRFLVDAIDQESERNFVINETAALALGFTPESAVGKQFTNEQDETKNIVGVVKDFHMHSMHIPIAPLMIGNRTWRRYLSVQVAPQNTSETIEFLKQTIDPFSAYPFEYQFVDNHFAALYQSEKKLGQIFSFFTVLAIVIASLGLFGLAAFTAQQKTKEIGIRKVLGAGFKDLTLSFSKSFLQLVWMGFFLAVPIAWYTGNIWLENYAYRTDVSISIFLMVGVATTLLAFATISSQSIKVSRLNPVESLKDE